MSERDYSMTHFREDEELLGEALKQAFDLPEDVDARFQKLLDRLEARAKMSKAA